PGRGDLGLPERSISQQRSGQGTKPRQLYPLVHERPDLLDLSHRSGALQSSAVRFLLSHDGGAILRRTDDLSRDERRPARADSEKAGHRLTKTIRSFRTSPPLP